MTLVAVWAPSFSVAPLVGAWIEICIFGLLFEFFVVAPLVGAWIEIITVHDRHVNDYVAPLVGAWIEINVITHGFDVVLRSLPSWERGLKYNAEASECTKIRSLPSWERGLKWKPLPGIRLEPGRSLPSWERGLKLSKITEAKQTVAVAPLVGAWIEMPVFCIWKSGQKRRSPRGSVD